MLVFCCFVNNYPIPSSLKQHPFLSSQFCSLWIRHGMAGFSAQGLRRLKPRQQGSVPLWRLWGRACFQVLSGGWQYSVPAGGLTLSSLGCSSPFFVLSPSSNQPWPWVLLLLVLQISLPPLFKAQVIRSRPLRSSPCFQVSCAIEHNIITGGIPYAQVPGSGHFRILPVTAHCPGGWNFSWKGGPWKPGLFSHWKRTALGCSVQLMCFLNELQR